MSIQCRAVRAIDLRAFAQGANAPEALGPLFLDYPRQEQHILRMLIRRPFDGLRLPHSLQWVLPMIGMAEARQASIARHPFLYLTVRNGMVASQGDDEWHVDGFSLQYNHLPEQNYIWSDFCGTEYYKGSIDIPEDFDPLFHNLHLLIQERIDPALIVPTISSVCYVLDPYVIHRRPPETAGSRRCFVRLSYTPIEIADQNNTLNPLLPTNYTRDGVKDFRDRLVRYAATDRP
jgi:hypothetical protein